MSAHRITPALAVAVAAAIAVPVARAGSPPPFGYAAEFVSTAAVGTQMNASGDVTGTSYPDPGCGSFCLPTQETVVWKGGTRIVLPSVPGLSGIYVRGINAAGWVTGLAGLPGTTTHAVVWKPNGTTYTAIDLGTLPGTTISEGIGIDDAGRVIGWCSTLSFPPTSAPFMWTEAGGMVNLATQGFPVDKPLAISRGGTVATPGYWYRLGDPASVQAMTPVPQGFLGPSAYAGAINDAGEQVRFLPTTSSENLLYLFRYHPDGTWQQISFIGQGFLTQFGVGGINADGDVSCTILSTARIAYGTTGMLQDVTPLLSPAYAGATASTGGTITDSGMILAQVFIGNSPRLMRLTPAAQCTNACLRSSTVQMSAKFIQDPRNPGSCGPGIRAYNKVSVRVTVTNELGTRLSGVTVSGRILDDYWTNAPFTATTNSQGVASFAYRGNCGVGAIAFLVDNLAKAGSTFDKSTGDLFTFAIPAVEPSLALNVAETDAASSLSLATVFPAPGNGTALLRYSLPASDHVTLRVFDSAGEWVATLVDGVEESGVHTVTWNGRRAHGTAAPRGMYYAELDAGGASSLTRIALVR